MKFLIRLAVVLNFATVIFLITDSLSWFPEPSRHEARPEDIAELIDQADRVVVHGGYQSSNRQDLEALKKALQIERPKRLDHCTCSGTSHITLHKGEKQVAHFSYHHAKSLRCNLWMGEAPIADVAAFLRWFEERGILEPRREYEANLVKQQASINAEKKWVVAMPSSLRPFWPDGFSESERAVAALDKQFPDESKRIRALFAWYGSGAGPWYDHRGYESVPENMLLSYPVSDLIAAATAEMTVAQTEGCARLFAAYKTAALPVDLKRRLLQHCLAKSRPENHVSARAAFE